MSKITSLILRAALSFAFLFPAIHSFFYPYDWFGYFPDFVGSIPVETILLLHIFSAIEIILALWILSGKRIFFPSVLCALILALIIGFNWSKFPVLFRDVPILLIAVALALGTSRFSIERKELR